MLIQLTGDVHFTAEKTPLHPFSDINVSLIFSLNDSPVMHAEQPRWRHEMHLEFAQ